METLIQPIMRTSVFPNNLHFLEGGTECASINLVQGSTEVLEMLKFKKKLILPLNDKEANNHIT